MPTFFYKAVDANKKIVHGQMSAKTQDEVARQISRNGFAPLMIKSSSERQLIKGSVPIVEKMTFCRYLSIMLSTGMSLSEGIDVLQAETKNPLMNKILGDISYSMEQGQQLSAIFERYPTIFEPYFLTLTRAGEMSGKLAEVFKYLESELRSEYSLNAKVKGALLYPAVVVIAMVGIGGMMFFFILPQIGRVFLNMNMPLAAPIKFLFTASIVLSAQFIPIVIGAVILGGLFVYSLKKRAMRDFLFMFIRPVPVVHNLLTKIDLARFTRLFSTLIRSAVPITDALEISLLSLSMAEFRSLAKVFPDEIKRGKSLASLIKEYHQFPTLFVQMVAAGEKTGTLDAMMADLATFYEQEVEEEVKGLTQIIEPVLMICVGIAVGAMIISIIYPIYSVVGNFQSAAGGAP